MADEPNAVDPEDEAEDVPDDEAVESPIEEAETVEEPVAVTSRGMRLLRSLVLMVVVAVAILELSSPLCSVYSLGALERAFANSQDPGLTLETAQGHVMGLAMMSFREEWDGSPESKAVHYAVFTWPSLFRVHSFEVEIEKVSFSDMKEGVILVRSQPYISQEIAGYQLPDQPDADPQWLQVLKLTFEADSKDTDQVERWQVERAIKNGMYEPGLLAFFDENDKNQDGAVTPEELGRARGPEFFPLGQSRDGDKSKGAAGR